MKIKGYKPENPNIETVVIPRGENEPLVFKVQAVLDDDSFEKLCQAPMPPTIVRPDKSKSINTEDPTYRSKLTEHIKLKNFWILIQSLRATEGLEWEKVKYEDPDTWKFIDDELKDFKLTRAEINMIIESIWSVNGLNEDKLIAARESFLAGREVAASKL